MTNPPSITPTRGVAALFNIDVAEFRARYFPNQFLYASGPLERLRGLADYSFDELVKMDKGFIWAWLRTSDTKAERITITPDQAHALYDAGATIYFFNLKSAEISSWLSAIDDELGLVRGITRVSAFASRTGLGLPPHYDHNDNIVCQAAGTKRFRIAPNTHVRNPTLDYTIGNKPTLAHEAEAPDGFPTAFPEEHRVVEMTPGSVMFMPRGMWHCTETVAEASLHFNVSSGLPKWKDVIAFLLTQTTLLHEDEFREAILDMYENGQLREGFQEELKGKLRHALDMLLDGDVPISQVGLSRYIMTR